MIQTRPAKLLLQTSRKCWAGAKEKVQECQISGDNDHNDDDDHHHQHHHHQHHHHHHHQNYYHLQIQAPEWIIGNVPYWLGAWWWWTLEVLKVIIIIIIKIIIISDINLNLMMRILYNHILFFVSYLSSLWIDSADNIQILTKLFTSKIQENFAISLILNLSLFPDFFTTTSKKRWPGLFTLS